MIDTLPSTTSRDGLGLGSIDLTLMLVRSMLEEVRNYVLLRAAGDGYVSYRRSVLRFEGQKRLFAELKPAVLGTLGKVGKKSV